jgi:hypothetical protein
VGEVVAYVSLLFSLLALLGAAFCVLRGAPARIEAVAREAFNRADSTQVRYEAFLSEATSILGSVQEERERAVRAQRRASADRVKIEGVPDNSEPRDRGAQMAEYRKQAGLI